MTIEIFINGIDRTDKIRFDSLRKEDNLNSLVDTLSFAIEKGGTQTYAPSVNDEVTMFVDSVKVFGGRIVEISQSVDGHHLIVYRIQCKDYAHELDRFLVTERYENQTVEEIIDSLVQKYAIGFTTTNVVASTKSFESITFNRTTVSDVFSKIARLINYMWYVDYDKDIHFFAKNEEVAPFDITDNSTNVIKGTLEVSTDFTQIRNRIMVRGGEAESNERTETHSGTGNKDEFALAYKYATKPVVEVSSVAQTVGLDGLDDDAAFDCMWSFQEKYIRFTAGNTPAAGTDNVSVTGIPLLPLNIIVSDSDSITTYGTYEYKKDEPALRTRDDAVAYGNAELDAYKNPIKEVSFETYTSGVRSGHVMNVNSTMHGVNDDFIVQRVVMQLVSQDTAQYTIELSTLKIFTLTQLLQEILRRTTFSDEEDVSIFSFIQMTGNLISMTDSVSVSRSSYGPYYYT